GKSGPVGLVRGGYDYHDNTRTTGDTKDREAGRYIGMILETAAALGKPVCLYVTTDGAVVSDVNNTARNSPWVSDRGISSLAYLLMYDPAKRPQTTGFQVGSFGADQSVDPVGVSTNPEAVAQAIFANYLQLNK